jgi:hypothetical protein
MVGAVGGSLLSSLHAARAATDSRQHAERVAGCMSLSLKLGGAASAHAAVSERTPERELGRGPLMRAILTRSLGERGRCLGQNAAAVIRVTD